MELGERVAPPRGYIDFCAREPAECPPAMRQPAGESAGGRLANYWRVVFRSMEPAALPRGGGGGLESHDAPGSPADAPGDAPRPSGPLHTTPALLRELDAVNRWVNDRIRPESDMEVYGRSDYWALPLERGAAGGDCEDYVLEKRRALRQRGYPDNLLSIAMVTTTWGEKHAVLLVDADEGELVLDSLTGRILPWRETTYRWESRQSPEDPSVWVAGPDEKRRRGR